MLLRESSCFPFLSVSAGYGLSVNRRYQVSLFAVFDNRIVIDAFSVFVSQFHFAFLSPRRAVRTALYLFFNMEVRGYMEYVFQCSVKRKSAGSFLRRFHHNRRKIRQEVLR